MTDSKTSHWKSLAADLSGTTPADENPADTNSDPDGSTTCHTTGDISARTDVTRASVNEDSSEIQHPENPPVSSDRPPKKKKRGSWAFWRSGNKEKKDDGKKSSGSDSSVAEDPLALLNQAETTDDMACAIDQLFANNGADTRGDEVVFDADEIATSIDFEEETKTRDSNADGSRSDRRSKSRGKPDSGRRGDEDSRRRANHSRDSKEDSRQRDGQRSNNREESRSRGPDRRDRDAGSDHRQGSRRRETPTRDPIDHGDVPTWDTAVSFVVDNNMLTRDGKSASKKKTRSRSKRRSRN